jgi:NAD(P)-dependent dehydrogenase (short-subunit alcohol dehydrogenase family)
VYEQDLKGKVAFITGAGGGIGRAIALRLVREGCHLAIMDLDRSGAEDTARSARSAGGKAVVLQGDVAESADVARCVRSAEDELGGLDLLVNNAGVLPIGSVQDTSEEEWRRTFRVNVDGVFHCCKAVSPAMVRRRQGRIINIASWFGKTGKPYNAAYCATKFAVIGFTQSLAQELAAHRVTVNAICPGTVTATAMRERADETLKRLGLPTSKERESGIPLGRLCLPEDVARVAAFLASGESAYMTGQAINVTGGLWMH